MNVRSRISPSTLFGGSLLDPPHNGIQRRARTIEGPLPFARFAREIRSLSRKEMRMIASSGEVA
ncbi:hypothetical protein [Paraburkholderia atlantica]|uniref:hypothetical protein n=1 Tax=Paraburkholderia atlantica TaxID=2654982 RepID=UPI0016085248|nr:hypothetical protein [Paraburkholderia atlantica]MBB5504594.1 hypothetical protein [Paraburkholderia atlantica]